MIQKRSDFMSEYKCKMCENIINFSDMKNFKQIYLVRFEGVQNNYFDTDYLICSKCVLNIISLINK